MIRIRRFVKNIPKQTITVLFASVLLWLSAGCDQRALSTKCQKIDIAKNNGTEIIYFHARWCKICIYQSAVVAQIGKRYPQISVTKIDIDQLPALADCYGVDVVPTIVIKKDGVIQKVFEGLTKDYRITSFFPEQ